LEEGISNGGVGHGDGKTEKFGSQEKCLWIDHSLNFGMKVMKKSGNVEWPNFGNILLNKPLARVNEYRHRGNKTALNVYL
jgi:hypothetical protein